jgi:hypothetical protein
VSADARFDAAVAAIDAANAADPTTLEVGARRGPKELVHAEMATEWVRRLDPDPAEPLLLAARGHHLRRWTVPRATYPAGRAGYLRWRRDLHRRHAEELGEILAGVGYDRATIDRVGEIVRKERLGRDPDVQTLEDALCLVFLETQLTDVATRLDDAQRRRVVDKTLAKMSPAGRAAIASVPLSPEARALLGLPDVGAT